MRPGKWEKSGKERRTRGEWEVNERRTRGERDKIGATKERGKRREREVVSPSFHYFIYEDTALLSNLTIGATDFLITTFS